MPQRIQLKRTKGWHKPPGAVVVSRPSRWGNPYRVDELGVEAVLRYRDDLLAGKLGFGVDDVRRELRGRDLACWCSLAAHPDLGLRCHADVLLQVANG